MSHRPEQRSFRARYVAGPAARVGIHTAGHRHAAAALRQAELSMR